MPHVCLLCLVLYFQTLRKKYLCYLILPLKLLLNLQVLQYFHFQYTQLILLEFFCFALYILEACQQLLLVYLIFYLFLIRHGHLRSPSGHRNRGSLASVVHSLGQSLALRQGSTQRSAKGVARGSGIHRIHFP